DDTYGWEFEQNVTFYKPYNKSLPTKQARLLTLWDFLGIPHKEKKQLSGSCLPIIGFEVDPNGMSISLPQQSKEDLVTFVQHFVDSPSRRRKLGEYQSLAGWMNWSFNVFPLLRPSLSNVYDKMKGKTNANASIYLNEAVKDDLRWFIKHITNANGVLLFEGMDWDPLLETNMTIFCDACLDGVAFWIPELLLGFYAPISSSQTTIRPIFFYESLAVVSAVKWFCMTARSDESLKQNLRLTVFTDSSNTVDIFSTLRALPDYNGLLRFVVDELIAASVDIRVLHVPGEQNAVADAISRHDFDRAKQLAPGLSIEFFQPPRVTLGAPQL
ncbi:hypothetical protein F5877DRAFT_55804, partial [Lentinula edodes]